MTKKEFRKKCKKDKTTSYKLMFCGSILSLIGLIIVLIVLMFFDEFPIVITCNIIGGLLALIGMTLDLSGEYILAKEYKTLKQ